MSQPNRTCMIYFSENKKKIDKEQAKLLAKFKKNSSVKVELLPTDKFRFTKPELE